MSRSAFRGYVAAWALLVLVVGALATNRAGVWGRPPAPEPDAAAMVRAERAHRATLIRAQQRVERRWQEYRQAKERRLARIARARKVHRARLEARERAIAARRRQIARIRGAASARA
ncbi:MAG: hypothetical protein MUE51_09985 [Thermoleophilia bacterium]|nr:hypothetical protein [Thermoleophilia bacterium]